MQSIKCLENLLKIFFSSKKKKDDGEPIYSGFILFISNRKRHLFSYGIFTRFKNEFYLETKKQKKKIK